MGNTTTAKTYTVTAEFLEAVYSALDRGADELADAAIECHANEEKLSLSTSLHQVEQAQCWVTAVLEGKEGEYTPQAFEDGHCRVCGEHYEDGGDGYDGLCPECADEDEEDV